jgi:16S rRNA (adenine1518-N6/adenine1519-N6)-dimethyltransferase
MTEAPTVRRPFRPRRAKGQSFLRERAVVERIVSAIGVHREEALLEVGAGSGEMTLPLAAAGAGRILAVEPDPTLSRELQQRLEKRNIHQVEVTEEDFLSLDLEKLLTAHGLEQVRVVGNLPYSIASPILLKLLSHRTRLSEMTLMFQLEVAERLTANPHTKAYGVLTVLTQQATRPRLLFQIPPHAFWPRPKVWSALVRFDFLQEREPDIGDPAIFQELVKTLFAHRRKNISNNIKRLKSPLLQESTLQAALDQLRIDPSRRAETLTVEEFAAMSHFCTSPQ